jgi:hypothetical protein
MTIQTRTTALYEPAFCVSGIRTLYIAGETQGDTAFHYSLALNRQAVVPTTLKAQYI